MTHYERLGVAPTATQAELREAYRRAARESHPDRHGDAASGQMAAINEAWRVLGEPASRRRYDAALHQLAGGEDHPAGDDARPRPAASTPHEPEPEHHEPARFPWRFMAVMASLGIGVVVIGAIVYEPADEPAPDGVLRPGDCVTVATDLSVAETRCSGPHDAVVQVLVPFDQICPSDTESYRDRQGMGIACVVRSAP